MSYNNNKNNNIDYIIMQHLFSSLSLYPQIVYFSVLLPFFIYFPSSSFSTSILNSLKFFSLSWSLLSLELFCFFSFSFTSFFFSSSLILVFILISILVSSFLISKLLSFSFFSSFSFSFSLSSPSAFSLTISWAYILLLASLSSSWILMFFSSICLIS